MRADEARYKAELRDSYFGYKILNGPPIDRPPILFLGYQPGGGPKDYERYLDAQGIWPPSLEYLKGHKREGGERLWGFIRHRIVANDGLLAGCMGMNAIFFRAPNVKAWEASNVSELEALCLKHTATIIRSVQPKLIVSIGFTRKGLVEPTSGAPLEDNGITLARPATAFGSSAIITCHLTGTRGLTNAHRNMVGKYIRDRLNEN